MSARSPWMRLFALRRLQEERVEAQLRARRREYEAVLLAAEQCRLETRETARALVTALEAGQHEYEVAAGIHLKLIPLRERMLAQQLLHAETLVRESAQEWQRARRERMQAESVMSEQERRAREEAAAKEQKSIDGWFLMRRQGREPKEAQSSAEHESSQRVFGQIGRRDGTTLAESEVR